MLIKMMEEEIFPIETFHKLGELGFYSIPFPEKNMMA